MHPPAGRFVTSDQAGLSSKKIGFAVLTRRRLWLPASGHQFSAGAAASCCYADQGIELAKANETRRTSLTLPAPYSPSSMRDCPCKSDKPASATTPIGSGLPPS